MKFQVDVWLNQTAERIWMTDSETEARQNFIDACVAFPDRIVSMRGVAGLVLDIRHPTERIETFDTRTAPRPKRS